MDRTERLLDLVALLLDAPTPVSWAQIREAFPDDYDQGSADASERKFERDKAELLELGIPLEYAARDENGAEGYVVNREAYYLPRLDLSPDELAVLYAAGSAALSSEAFPGKQDLAHALRKVAFYAGPHLPKPQVRLELGGVSGLTELPLNLERLWAAISARKSVELVYFSPKSLETTRRKVDPYGLALRRGIWSLVGYCHLRAGLRTFHVHRVRELKANALRPRSPDFELPKDFSLNDYVAHWPWQHRFHEPVQVEVEVSGALKARAENLFGVAPVHHGEVARVTVSATDVDGLLRYVVSLGPLARVVGPSAAKAQYRKLLTSVLERHA